MIRLIQIALITYKYKQLVNRKNVRGQIFFTFFIQPLDESIKNIYIIHINKKKEDKTMKKFQTTKGYTLKIADKAFAAIEKDYIEVSGKMDVCTISAIFDSAASLLSGKNLVRGCTYKVLLMARGNGYAKSCKYSRNDIKVTLKVTCVSSKESKAEIAVSERVTLHPGEVISDCVTTDGAATRAAHIARFIDRGRDADCPCWIKGVPTLGYQENKAASKRVWERFLEAIFDFTV